MKPKTFRSEPLRRAVADLACRRCGIQGWTQAAHSNEGKGMGIKASDARIAALCHTCHAEIDQGRDMTREERRAAMRDAILETLVELIETERLVVR
jgi:hypothetical protein